MARRRGRRGGRRHRTREGSDSQAYQLARAARRPNLARPLDAIERIRLDQEAYALEQMRNKPDHHEE